MYLEMMSTVLKFGHGVFTLTMIEDVKVREQARKYLQRHPSFFSSMRGAKGDLNIHLITRRGASALGELGTEGKSSGETSAVTSSRQFASLLDLAVINAYMWEKKCFVHYEFRPHLVLVIEDRRVGILSEVWGPTKSLSDVDLLIGTEKLKQDYLKDKEAIKKIALRDNESEKVVKEKIASMYVPKALIGRKNG